MLVLWRARPLQSAVWSQRERHGTCRGHLMPPPWLFNCVSCSDRSFSPLTHSWIWAVSPRFLYNCWVLKATPNSENCRDPQACMLWEFTALVYYCLYRYCVSSWSWQMRHKKALNSHDIYILAEVVVYLCACVSLTVVAVYSFLSCSHSGGFIFTYSDRCCHHTH